jgi:hypothetical protein
MVIYGINNNKEKKMTKEIKIYKYTVYEDNGITTQFGTEQSKEDWEYEQKLFEEDGFSTSDDSIECIGSVTPDAEGIEKLLGMIPSFNEEQND